MSSKSVLARFAIFFVKPFSPQSWQRDLDPEAMIIFYGESASHLLLPCQAAVKIEAGTTAIKPTEKDIQDAMDSSYCRGYVLGVVDSPIFS